jgi:hypothetical protein
MRRADATVVTIAGTFSLGGMSKITSRLEPGRSGLDRGSNPPSSIPRRMAVHFSTEYDSTVA